MGPQKAAVMPDFKIPETLPPNARFVSLSISETVSIGTAAAASLRSRVTTKDDSFHVAIRQPVAVGDCSSELRGLIGIHGLHAAARSRRRSKSSQEKGPRRFIHYELGLRSTSFAKTIESDSWDEAFKAVAEKLGTHSVSVNLSLSLSEETRPKIQLPIMVSQAEAMGFTEIRGIRLVQVEPKATGELYSVIVDRSANGRIGLSVSTQVEVTLSTESLLIAFTRAMSIANLTFWPETPS